MSSLGIRYSGCENPVIDQINLVQDSMFHERNEYCLGEVDVNGKNSQPVDLGTVQNCHQTKVTLLEKNYNKLPKLKKTRKELSICCYLG